MLARNEYLLNYNITFFSLISMNGINKGRN